MDIEKMINCVKREIKMRENAYPKWVAQGSMNGGKAQEEIQQMKDVLTVLTAVRYSDFEALRNLNPGKQTDLFLTVAPDDKEKRIENSLKARLNSGKQSDRIL